MKDSLLFKCLLVSAALHAVAVTVFFAQPLHFNPRSTTFLGKSQDPPIFEISIVEKEAALEEAMKNFVVVSSQPSHGGIKSAAYDVNAVEENRLSYNHFLALDASDEIILPEVLPTQPLLIPENNPSHPILDHSFAHLSPPTIEPLMEDLHLHPCHSQPLIPDGALDFEFFPSPEIYHQVAHSPAVISSHALIATDTFLLSKQELLPDKTPSLSQTPKSSTPLSIQQPVITLQYPTPSMSHYGIPEFSTLEWNDTFNVDIKTYAQEDGSHLFSLTFLPKLDLSQYRLKQNYYFLIDRSNSIEKHRYQTFKRATTRALGVLREGDHFNIVIFDSKIVHLSEHPLPFNKKNQQAAEEFLEKQSHGHYGAATDMYALLGRIIPHAVNDNDAHIAILISDGDSHIKADKQRKMINDWLQLNRGRVTLYTAAVGQGNNLPMLDLLGTASRGSLLYSDTHTGFPRKLAKLILSLRAPIAQEMSFSLLPSDPLAKIEILPSSSRLPYLFNNHPFVLFGKAEKLSDFSIILQGRNQKQLLSIKKNISFAHAKPGNRLLVKQWSTYQAHHLYEQYLQEGKITLLEEAKKLLSNDTAHSRRRL